MDTILENRTWRYATKKFDTTKKVSDADLDLLLEATRLSASSYGLQPYHVFVITDQEVREKLKPVSWGQTQITDASHLLVFAGVTNFDASLIDNYLVNVSQTRNIPKTQLKEYGDFMKSNILDLPSETKQEWAARQVYLALGNVMQAAAELQIDTCPMEGFEAEKYDEILNLKEKGLTTVLVLPVGYRAAEDITQHLAKVRKTKEELFTHI